MTFSTCGACFIYYIASLKFCFFEREKIGICYYAIAAYSCQAAKLSRVYRARKLTCARGAIVHSYSYKLATRIALLFC